MPLTQTVAELRPKIDIQKRRHSTRVKKTRESLRGMKDRVDKSMGIVTRIAEALARIKPTEPLRLAKREAHKKRNCSDSSGNSPVKILASRYAWKKISRVKSS